MLLFSASLVPAGFLFNYLTESDPKFRQVSQRTEVFMEDF